MKTVGELIKVLQNYPADLPVVVNIAGDKEELHLVWIDSADPVADESPEQANITPLGVIIDTNRGVKVPSDWAKKPSR